MKDIQHSKIQETLRFLCETFKMAPTVIRPTLPAKHNLAMLANPIRSCTLGSYSIHILRKSRPDPSWECLGVGATWNQAADLGGGISPAGGLGRQPSPEGPFAATNMHFNQVLQRIGRLTCGLATSNQGSGLSHLSPSAGIKKSANVLGWGWAADEPT